MKKKIILSFVGIIVIVIGIFAAYFVVEANKDAAVIEDTDAKFTSDLIEISDNSTPEEHSASDVIAMALWKIANTDAFRTETTGTADASIATQLIAGERIVVGDNAMVRSISSGFVSVGSERFFYKDKVLLREPESIDGVNATFKTVEPECLTIDGYIQRYGWLPYQATGYIISKDTYLTEPTMVNNGDGTYTLIMDLNPDGDYAPFWYRREVLTNSSSTIIPEFFKIHMEITIDSTYTILSNDIQEEYQVKSMGVTATSKTKVHEVFYYDNISFPEDITNFYDQYKGMEASNGEDTPKEPDNLSIITEALIGKTSNYQVNINLNGEDINGNVYLNLLDIDNVNVVAELLDGALYVEFTDALYLSYGNIKLKLDINELSSLIPASETEGEGTSSIDVAGIIADIQNGKVSKVDNLTVISTTLNIMGIKINVIFEVKMTEDAYTMQSISGNISIAGFDIKVSLKPTDKKTEKRDTTEFKNIMDAKDIISKIIDIVSSKKIDLSLDLVYQDIKASGVVTLDFSESLKALANLDLTINDKTYNVKAIYQDKVIYLDFKNIHAKISVDTLTSLFDLGELKNSSNIKIVEMLSSDEIKNLINFEELGENIKVLISASSINSLIKKELLTEDIKININTTDDKVNLSVNMLDLNISLSKSENVIDINPDNYVSLDNLVKNAFDIYNTLKDGGRININANIDLKELANIDLALSLDGYIDLFINGKDISVSGILNVNLGNNTIKVKFLFEDNTLTVELLNNTIRLTVDEIKNLINEITTRFNLANTNTLNLNINELLDGITLTDEGVSLDLSSLLSKLGVVSVSLKDKVEVSSGLFNAEITFANLGEKVTFEGDVITYEDIISILDKVNVITNIIDDKKLDLTLSFKYSEDIEATLKGTLDFSDKDNIKAKLNAKVTYKDYLFDLNVTYANNKIYLDFNNIHGAISLDTIKSLIPTSDINLDLDINSIVDLAFKLVKEINLKELKLTLAKDALNDLLNEFIGDLFKLDEDLVIDLDITDKASLNINLFDIVLVIAKTDANIEVNEDNYISLDNLALNVIDIVKDITDGARINIDANINLKDLANIDLTLDLSGYVDLIKENDKFIISSILNVKVSNSELVVKLLFEDNTLTVELLNNTIRLSVSEIQELINEITTRFNLGETKFELNINELLNGISLTNDGIKADLSSVFTKLGEVALSITDKISISNSFVNLNVTLADTEDKVTFEGDVIEYQDIIEILDKVDRVLDIINDKKFDIDLSLDYKDLHVEALGTIDLSNGISADVKVKLADFEVGIKFINNAIYLNFQNIHGKLKLETLKKLLPSNINLDLNIDVNEVIDLVFNLLDEINLKDLSLSLKKDEVNKLLDKYLGFITLDDNLDIKLNITDKINLLVSLFNIDLTISKTEKEITVDEDSYSELGYLTERIYDIYMRAKDGKRININAIVDLSKFTNIDLALSLDGYVDFFINDGKVTLSSILNLKVGNNDIEINLLFNDDIITVELLNNVIKLSVDDIKDLLNEITTKFIKLGTNNDTATIDIVSLLKSVVLTEDSISVDLSSFAEMLGVITLKITDNDIKVINNAFSASVTLADTGKLVVIDDTNAIDKVYLDSLIDNVSYILDILNEKKLGIDLSIGYKDISAKVEGIIDFSDKIKLDIDACIKYKDLEFNPNIKLVDDILYVSLNSVNASIKLETIKGLLDNTNNTKLEVSEIIDLVFDLLDEINLRDLSVSLKKDKLNELVNKYLDGLLKEDLFTENLVAKVLFNDGVNLTLNQFGFDAKVSKTNKEVVLDKEYESVDTLVNNVVGIVKDILDDNGARLNINANINLKDLANIDLSLGLTGYVDILKSDDKFMISSVLTVKVSESEIEVKVLFADDTLTISLLGNTITLTKDEIKDLITDIKTKFADENSSESNLDIESIIDGLTLTNTGISADLSSLLSKLGTLALTITSDKITLANDSIDALITIGEVGSLVTIKGEALTYSNISDLLDEVKTIVDIIKTKKLDLALSLKYKDIEVIVSGLVDFKDKEDIKLDVQANIKYKENEFNANIKLVDKVLYLDMANIHSSVKLETVKGLLGDSETESSIDINEIIDLVFKSLDTIDLKNLKVVLTTTELNKFIKDLAGEVIKEDLLEGDLIINLDVTDKVEVTLNQFDLKATISSSTDEVVLDTNTTYVEIDALVDDIVAIVKDVLDDTGARLNINANINLKELANIDLELALTGYVDIVKANDKFTISSVLKVKVSETEIEVKVLYKEDTLTISLLDNIISLSKDEIKELITDIKAKFASENSSESTLDIASIIDGLSLTQTGANADLSSIISELGVLALTISKDEINVTNDSVTASITFGEVEDVVTIDGEALTYSDVNDLLDKVKTIVDIIKDKKLDLALSFKYKDIEASVSGLVDFTDKEDIKLSALANIKYKENEFDANVKLIDKVLYLDIANIHGSLKLESVKGLLSDTESTIDINEIIDLVFKSLDTIDLKNLKVILTPTELNKFINDLVGSIIKEDLLEGNLVVDVEVTDKVAITANQFDLTASISKSTDEVVLDTNTTYVEIDSLVDDIVAIVKDVLDDNGARLNLSANVSLKDLANIDLSLGLTGYLDILKTKDKLTISSVLTIKVSESEIEVKLLYKEDTLTISLLDNIISLSKEDIKNLITDIKTKFADENSTESTLDIASIIDGLTLTNIGISADLSSLLSKLGTLALTITSDKITLANDSIDALITFGEVEDTVTIDGEALTYSNVSDLLDKVKTIVDIVKDKKLDLALSLKYKDIEAQVSGLVDFKDKEDIKLDVQANIKYKENEFDANVKLIDKVLYLDMANIHGSLKLETIKSLLSDTESTIDINEIIDLVFKSLDTLDLKNLKVILTPTELNKFINDLAGSVIKEDLLDGNLIINLDVTDKVSITANQFDLTASISKSTDEVVLDTNTTYVEIDALVDDVVAIVKDVLDDTGARLNINANINLKKLLNMDMDVKLTGYADIIKDQNDKLTISAYINIEVKDYIAELYVAFENDTLYVKGFNNATLLSVDEIKTIIERIKTKYFADSNMNLNLESIINNIYITNDDIKLDLVSIHEILEGLVLTITDSSITLENESITLGLSVTTIGDDKVEVGTYNIDYTRITNLLDNFDYIYDIIMNKESYEFSFDLDVLDNYEKNIDAYGTINVLIEDDGTLKVKIKGHVIHKNIDHDVEIIYISNPKDEEGNNQFLSGNIYFIYGNNCGSNKKLRFSSSVENILAIIEQVAVFLGVEDVDMVNDPKSILGILDKFDLGAGTNNNKLVVSDLLSELEFTDDSIDMKLSNQILFYFATRLMDISITAKEGELSGSLTGLYTKYLDEANNTMLNINSFNLTNNKISITAPSDTGYEISDSHKLIEGLVNLVNTNNVSLSGTVTLTAVGLLDVNVPVEVIINNNGGNLLDDPDLEAYVHLNLTNVPVLGEFLVSKKHVYIYYKDKMVYIDRQDNSGDRYQIKISQETFLNDIVYYLLDFAMGLSDTITSKINTNKSDEKQPIDASVAWKSYSYSNNSFTVSFDMGELTGNSDLGTLYTKLNLSTATYNDSELLFLSSISDFSFDMVSVIELHSTTLNINNISNGKYNIISAARISNYTDNYLYETDLIYKNGSFSGEVEHIITFVKGFELESTSQNGTAGSTVIFPDMPELTIYKDKYYAFDGWYLDKGFTESALNLCIGSKSQNVYAKWKLVVKEDLTVYDYNGVSHQYETYAGADISKYLDYSLYYDSGANKYYLLEGFYTDSLKTNSLTTMIMPEDNLTVYTNWALVKYYARVNNDSNIDNNDLLDSSYSFDVSKTYYVLKNNIYYGLLGNMINYSFVINNYTSGLEIEGDKIIVDLYTDLSLLDLNDTYKVTFDYNESKFTSSKYKSIIVPNSLTVTYDLLPTGKYNKTVDYMINYWYGINTDGTITDYFYYAGNINELPKEDITLYAYYASLDILEFGNSSFSGLYVEGYTYAGSTTIDVILPKYVYYAGEAKVLGAIKIHQDSNGENYSCFTAKTNIKNIYFNDGFKILGIDDPEKEFVGNTFKNCTNLTNVYITSTVEKVAVDSFYMNVNGNNKEYNNIKIYLENGSSLNPGNWYKDKSKGWISKSYTYLSKAGSFTSIENLVHNLF